jgi:tRNA-modifying protein YgfZ
MDDALFLDRSDRAKLRFTGEQRAWFLDQILTQSFDNTGPGDALETALLTVHGRMQAYAEFLVLEDALLSHAEPALRTTFPEDLRKYVFATRVEIEDVTDDFGLLLVAHPDVASLTGGLDHDALVHPTTSLGVPAAYLWVQRALVSDVTGHLVGVGVKPGTETEFEEIRIRNGIARWGYDMNEKTFPQEAGIDDRAVHYEKGCYLGQEAMAKIHFRGKVNRKLVRLEGEGPLEAGAEVVAGGTRLGSITSAADSVGLAMVKHTTEPGTPVEAGTTRARVLD